MIIATFAEKTVVDNLMNVKLIEERVTILPNSQSVISRIVDEKLHTFETEAVNTTTS